MEGVGGKKKKIAMTVNNFSPPLLNFRNFSKTVSQRTLCVTRHRRITNNVGNNAPAFNNSSILALQIVSDGHVRVSARSEVLLRGDDCVRAQLSTSRSVAAGLEDHDRMPHILTRVVASIARRLRLFVVASHCLLTPSTLRRRLLPCVDLTDGSKWSVCVYSTR